MTCMQYTWQSTRHLPLFRITNPTLRAWNLPGVFITDQSRTAHVPACPETSFNISNKAEHTYASNRQITLTDASITNRSQVPHALSRALITDGLRTTYASPRSRNRLIMSRNFARYLNDSPIHQKNHHRSSNACQNLRHYPTRE